MFFHKNDIICPEAALSARRERSWMRQELALLAPALAVRDGSYKAFGPYWWTLKALFRDLGVGKRAWFHGTADDALVRQACDYGNGVLNLSACLQYRAIHGYDTLGIDELHIVSWPDGHCSTYTVSDPDGSCQLDLFAEADKHDALSRRYLDDPRAYLARPWRSRGDTAFLNGDWWQALVCYKRCLGGTFDPSGQERQDAWLRLAETFRELGHHDKACFCYETLYGHSGDPWLPGYMAQCQLAMGHAARALELFDKVLAQCPANPEFAADRERAAALLTMPPVTRAGIELDFRQDRAS